MKKLYSIITLSFLMCTGCIPGTKQKESSNTPDSTDIYTCSTRSDTLKFHQKDSIFEGKSIPNYTLDITLPIADNNDAAGKAINNVLMAKAFGKVCDTPEETMQTYTDSITTSYRNTLTSFYDPDQEDMNGSLQFSSQTSGEFLPTPREGYISYTIYQQNYEGGAHGNHVITFLNFKAEDGSLIHKSNVFNESMDEALLKLIMQKMAKDYGYTTQEALVEATGITLIGDIFVADNFRIENDGITFVYNTYEIAPYSAGTINVFLGYDALKDVLLPEFVEQ